MIHFGWKDVNKHVEECLKKIAVLEGKEIEIKDSNSLKLKDRNSLPPNRFGILKSQSSTTLTTITTALDDLTIQPQKSKRTSLEATPTISPPSNSSTLSSNQQTSSSPPRSPKSPDRKRKKKKTPTRSLSTNSLFYIQKDLIKERKKIQRMERKRSREFDMWFERNQQNLEVKHVKVDEPETV